MKKLFYLMAATVMLCTSCEKFDDTSIWEAIQGLQNDVNSLKEQCSLMNTNITSIQTIVTALQGMDYITNVSPIVKDGEQIGYTVTFEKNGAITILNGEKGADGKDGINGKDGENGKDGIDGTDGKDGENGKDGKDGVDGSTPIISVAIDSDGDYYWTLNGEWLLDANGNKIRANGKDGADGKDGKDGENGKDGKDGENGSNGTNGVTPKLKVENGAWYVTYNEGASWTYVCQATTSGSSSLFSAVDCTNPDYVVFTLSNGTSFKVQTYTAYSKDIINFESPYLELLLVSLYDTNRDRKLSKSEAAAVTEFPHYATNGHYSLFEEADYIITSFNEFQYFLNINCFNFKRWVSLREITLPSGMISIPANCFDNCKALNKVVIPNTIKVIEEGAFAGCESLQNISIPEGVTSLGWGAFQGCRSLISVTLPSSITEIAPYLFDNIQNLFCKALTPPMIVWPLGWDSEQNPYIIPESSTIYVPRSSVEAYKTADGWKYYADRIVGYDF